MGEPMRAWYLVFHECQWQYDAIGNITVTEGDPFYCGGWTVTLVDGEVTGTVTVEVGGLTPYRLAQPMTIDMTAGRVTIAASEEPFATVSTTGNNCCWRSDDAFDSACVATMW